MSEVEEYEADLREFWRKVNDFANEYIEDKLLAYARAKAAQGLTRDEINLLLPSYLAQANDWKAQQLRRVGRTIPHHKLHGEPEH